MSASPAGENVEQPMLGLATTEELLTEVAVRMEVTQNSLKGDDLGRLCREAIANLDRGVLAYRTVGPFPSVAPHRPTLAGGPPMPSKGGVGTVLRHDHEGGEIPDFHEPIWLGETVLRDRAGRPHQHGWTRFAVVICNNPGCQFEALVNAEVIVHALGANGSSGEQS